jgi:hemerythrin-like metal-binding protein
MIREASNDSAALEKDVLSLQERVGVAAGAGTGGGAVRPLLTWTDALSTGYAEIDEQHRRLIALGNRLNEAVRSGQERQAAGGVFDELIDYTVNHFKFEEGLMDKHGYVAAEDHKGKHRQLVQDVLAHKARFEKGEALSSELMNFIRDWLVDHIMKTDKLLGRALLAAR